MDACVQFQTDVIVQTAANDQTQMHKHANVQTQHANVQTQLHKLNSCAQPHVLASQMLTQMRMYAQTNRHTHIHTHVWRLVTCYIPFHILHAHHRA